MGARVGGGEFGQKTVSRKGSGILSADTPIYRLRESEEAIFRFRMVVEGLTSNSIHASSLYNTISIRSC